MTKRERDAAIEEIVWINKHQNDPEPIIGWGDRSYSKVELTERLNYLIGLVREYEAGR